MISNINLEIDVDRPVLRSDHRLPWRVTPVHLDLQGSSYANGKGSEDLHASTSSAMNTSPLSFFSDVDQDAEDIIEVQDVAPNLFEFAQVDNIQESMLHDRLNELQDLTEFTRKTPTACRSQASKMIMNLCLPTTET